MLTITSSDLIRPFFLLTAVGSLRYRIGPPRDAVLATASSCHQDRRMHSTGWMTPLPIPTFAVPNPVPAPAPAQPHPQSSATYRQPPRGWQEVRGSLYCPITLRLVARNKLYRHKCAGCGLKENRADLVSFESQNSSVECCSRKIGKTACSTLRKNVYEHLNQATAFGAHKGREGGSGQCMTQIELNSSNPIQICKPLILIQSKPEIKPEAESNRIQSRHDGDNHCTAML